MILIIILTLTTITLAQDIDNNQTYSGPCNTKYPFGDEIQFNTNAFEKSQNPIHCRKRHMMNESEDPSACPYRIPQDPSATAMEPYILCPDSFQLSAPPGELLYTSTDDTEPALQCKKCNLKLTPDRLAVIVDCFQCFELPSPYRAANKIEKRVTYKVFFLQIANYTEVDVRGIDFAFD